MDEKQLFSEFILYLGFFFDSSSTRGRNSDSMLFGLTNSEWDSSFVARIMMLGLTLLTLNTSPLFTFLKRSPAFIILFPLGSFTIKSKRILLEDGCLHGIDSHHKYSSSITLSQHLMKPLNLSARLDCLNFTKALSSICRIRSRERSKSCPTSSRV